MRDQVRERSLSLRERALDWKEELENKSDEELIEDGREIHEEALSLFMRQCLICSIMAERHEGGLRILSREWGLSYGRVSEMSRIWNKIMEPILERKEEVPLQLEPEYFHIALRASEPVEAIAYAEEQKGADASFTCSKLKQALEHGMPTNINNCRRCVHYEAISGIILEIGIQSQKFSAPGKVEVCTAHEQLLGATIKKDLTEQAISCEDYDD